MSWESTAEAWVRICAKYGARIIIAGCVAAAAFGTVAGQLELDSDLASLLPETADSVSGLRDLESRYDDQIGRLTLFITNVPPDQHREVGALLATKIAPIEGVHRVVYRKPAERMKAHRLLYLETDDLDEVSRRVQRRIKWEKRRANPLFVDLGSSTPPEVDLTDIEAKYGTPSGPFYADEGNGALLVFVHPTFSATDLRRCRALVDSTTAAARAVLSDHAGAEVMVTGRYAKRIETQEIMERDLKLATGVALVALLLFLLLYLRSFTAVGVVLGPLVVGTLGAFAWAWLIFGKLNILTAFLGAILLGLGADFGIHLVSAYRHRRHSMDPRRAAVEMLNTAGRAGTYAALTTAVAFASVALSDFKAFHEFGIIATGGMVCIVLAFTGLLPPLLLLLDHRLTQTASDSRPARWLAKELDARGRGPTTIVLAIVLGTAAWGATHTGFDRSLDALVVQGTPMAELDQRVNQILGKSQTPAVVLATNPSQALKIERELSSRPDKAIDDVIAEHNLLPKEQPRKLDILGKLQQALESVPARSRSEEVEQWLAEVQTVLDGGALNFEDLPESITAPFATKDGSHVILVFPGVPLDELDSIELFVAATRDLPDGGLAISESSLLVEILAYVRQELPRMVGWTVLGLALVTLLGLGIRREAAFLLVAVVVTVVAAFGICGALGLQFNFMNAIIVPIWLGLGIDSFYHLAMHRRVAPDDTRGFVSVLGAVGAAIGTSIAGFGALAASHHAGLKSLAFTGVVGLCTIFVLTVLISVSFSPGRRPS